MITVQPQNCTVFIFVPVLFGINVRPISVYNAQDVI